MEKSRLVKIGSAASRSEREQRRNILLYSDARGTRHQREEEIKEDEDRFEGGGEEIVSSSQIQMASHSQLD